jgi:hypothetical protein
MSNSYLFYWCPLINRGKQLKSKISPQFVDKVWKTQCLFLYASESFERHVFCDRKQDLKCENVTSKVVYYFVDTMVPFQSGPYPQSIEEFGLSTKHIRVFLFLNRCIDVATM